MAVGKKVKSVEDLKKQLKKSGRGGIEYIGEDSPMLVRFLTEPEGWLGYREGWTGEGSLPLDGEDENDFESVSTRYVAPVLDLDEDRVIIIKIPVSLANQLTARSDRHGTLLDRDYELSRTGSGLKTEYMLSPEPRKVRKLDKYDIPDLDALEEALVHERDRQLNQGEDDKGRRPSRGKAKGRTASRTTKSSSKPAARRTARSPKKLSARQLQDASAPELRKIASSHGVSVGGKRRSEIVQEILDEQS